MKVKLRNIDPNPYRHMERYPIRRDKVEALKESITTTEWWSNVVARPSPEIPGHVQLAKEFGVTHDTIWKVVAGKSWTARSRPAGAKFRIAPSFVVTETDEFPEGTDFSKAYTTQDIADFTGWVQPSDKSYQWKVQNALEVLEVIEVGLLTEDDFEGISAWQCGEVARQAKREFNARKQLAKLEPRPKIQEKILEQGKADAADLARHIIGDLKSKERGRTHIDESAAASGKMTPRVSKVPPHIDTFAERLAASLGRLMEARTANRKIASLELFIEHQDKATPRSRRELAAVL